MRIEPYTPGRRAEWDGFVAAHPQASFRHLSGLFALEAEAGAANCSLMLYDDARLIGVLPLFDVTQPALRFLRVRTLTGGTQLPGGPLFAPELSSRRQRAALAELMAHVAYLARERGAEQVSISYPSVIGERTSLEHFGYLPLKPFGYRELNTVGLLLDLRAGVDGLRARLNANCRNKIRRAEREGAQFHRIEDRQEWLDCYELSVQTLGPQCHSPRTMEIVWDEFVPSGLATVGATTVDGQIASVVVVVGLGTSCYYWFGFNRRPLLLPGANNFALWHSILLWQGRGARFFELGSLEFGNPRQEHIATFKESFGGTPFYTLGGALELKPHRRALRELLSLAWARLARRRASAKLGEATESAAPEPDGGQTSGGHSHDGQPISPAPDAARPSRPGDMLVPR